MTILYINLKEVGSEYNSFAVIKANTDDIPLTDKNLKAAVKEHFDNCSEEGNPFLVFQEALTIDDLHSLLKGDIVTLTVENYDPNDGEIDIELEQTYLYGE